MKKKVIKSITLIAIGALLVGVPVGAATYISSRDIEYTTEHNENITNVNEALDDLINQVDDLKNSDTYHKITRFEVVLNAGNYDFHYDNHKEAFSFRVSIKDQYPNYKNVTRDNIYIDIANLHLLVYGSANINYYGSIVTTSYDNTTGEIVFTGDYSTNNGKEYGLALKNNTPVGIKVAIVE